MYNIYKHRNDHLLIDSIKVQFVLRNETIYPITKLVKRKTVFCVLELKNKLNYYLKYIQS